MPTRFVGIGSARLHEPPEARFAASGSWTRENAKNGKQLAKAGERGAPSSASLTAPTRYSRQVNGIRSMRKMSRVVESAMNNYLKPGLRFACLAIAIVGSGLVSCVSSADKKSAPSPSTSRVSISSKGLSGAELYSMHCNRCHPERYPTERTAAQWKTVMLHMQVRVNLPADQAKLILKYLQENSGR